MAVDDKAVLALRLQTRHGKKVGRRVDRIDFNSRVALQRKPEIHRLLVDENEIDLGMRHAAGLDGVFHRCFLPQLPDDFRVAALWPNEKREIVVETKLELEKSGRTQPFSLCQIFQRGGTFHSTTSATIAINAITPAKRKSANKGLV